MPHWQLKKARFRKIHLRKVDQKSVAASGNYISAIGDFFDNDAIFKSIWVTRRKQHITCDIAINFESPSQRKSLKTNLLIVI
jgi:hypothetical protein